MCMYACKREKKLLSKAQIYIKVSLNKDVPLSLDKDMRALFIVKKTDNLVPSSALFKETCLLLPMV